MKEMWETPRIAVEKFAANEYVAVCYQLACITRDNNENMPKKQDSDEAYTSLELWGEYGANDIVTVDGEEYSLNNSHLPSAGRGRCALASR